MRKCFIVSPIGNFGSPTRKHSDNVYLHLIKPACIKNEIQVIRGDEFTTSNLITDDIFKCLDTYDLVIADVTELNPNVFLELGYRMKVNKPFIIIKDSNYEQKHPFDIQNFRMMEYSLLPSDINDSIESLDKFIKSVDYSKNDATTLIPATEKAKGLAISRIDDFFVCSPTDFHKGK